MNAKKISAIILVSLLAASALSGCKKNETKPTDTTTDNNQFPLKQQITLKDWVPFSSTKIKTLADNKVYQELEKKTNIHMEFIHPAQGQEGDQFNIMMASNDLPDLIQGYWGQYQGGPDKAINDNVYVKLNDYIDKYAPNYKKYRNSNPDFAKESITDAGNIYSFDCYEIGDEPAWDGLILRKDWLDDLGLQPPKTIDELHNVLTQFKQKKGAQVPFIMNGFGWQMATSGALVSAYNVLNDFFNQDGAVKYGKIENGYKDLLTTLNQWYKEGLIDKDFATRDGKGDDALFTSGKAGAMFDCYSNFGGYNTAGKNIDPKFTIYGVANPTLKEGDKLHFRQTNFPDHGSPSIITTANKHIAETVKWLDYGYTDEGFLLYNYGAEHTSWEWKDGPVAAIDKPFYPEDMKNANKHPEYNDFMLKNPNGTAFWDLIDQYKVHVSSYLRDPMADGGMDGDVKQSMTEWSKPGNDWVMPPVNQTDAENQEISQVMNDVNTYCNEMQLKFVMGTEPLSKWDDYVAKVKAMGIEKAIKDKQAALDRYKKRK